MSRSTRFSYPNNLPGSLDKFNKILRVLLDHNGSITKDAVRGLFGKHCGCDRKGAQDEAYRLLLELKVLDSGHGVNRITIKNSAIRSLLGIPEPVAGTLVSKQKIVKRPAPRPAPLPIAALDPVPAPSEAAVVLLPQDVIMSVGEAVAPAVVSSAIAIKPRSAKTHIIFLTPDESVVYIHIAACFDEKTMCVGVPCELADCLDNFIDAGLLLRREDRGDNGHCPCLLLIPPSTIVDVRIASRQTVRRGDDGTPIGIAPVGDIAFSRVDDDGASYYRLPDGTELRAFKEFESFVVTGDTLQAQERSTSVCLVFTAIHQVALTPEEAAVLLRIHYGQEIVRATHRPIEVDRFSGEWLSWWTSTGSSTLNVMLRRADFNDLGLLFPTNDCQSYKFMPKVARICQFVAWKSGSRQPKVKKFGPKSQPTFSNPDHWVDALKVIAGPLFADLASAPPASEAATPAVIVSPIEVRPELPSESEITMIRVSPAEAAVILGFDREGGGSGISLLNSRFGGYLKSIGFLEVVGVKAHARTSINPDVASRVRFRFGKNTNLVARAAAFNGVPDAKQWRRDLLQIVDRTISDELTLGLVAQPEVVADESVAQTPVEPIVAEPTGASAPVSGGLALPASSDIGLMTDEQLADRLRLLTEFAARIEGERSTITAEIAERARRAEEARKAARRAELAAELADKRAKAEAARLAAEQAEAEAARLAAELDTLG